MTLTYKEYKSIIKYSKEDNVFYGMIEDIKDLITFEAPTEEQIETQFIKSVEEYIELKKIRTKI